MSETIYRVVCPDGMVPHDRTYVHLTDVVHEANRMDREHGDCDGLHVIQSATWTVQKVNV